MRKISTIIFLFILLSLSVSALDFEKDTTFKQGNVNYIFKENTRVSEFKPLFDGVIIDDVRIILGSQGGIINFTIINWVDSNDNIIGIKSNVPQKLTLSATDNNGNKLYFYDGTSYQLGDFNIGTDYIEGGFRIFDIKEEIGNTIDSFGDIINRYEKLDWYEKKFVEIETSTTETNGIIKGETFVITYLMMVIFVFIVIVGLIIWTLRRN